MRNWSRPRAGRRGVEGRRSGGGGGRGLNRAVTQEGEPGVFFLFYILIYSKQFNGFFCDSRL